MSQPKIASLCSSYQDVIGGRAMVQLSRPVVKWMKEIAELCCKCLALDFEYDDNVRKMERLKEWPQSAHFFCSHLLERVDDTVSIDEKKTKIYELIQSGKVLFAGVPKEEHELKHNEASTEDIKDTEDTEEDLEKEVDDSSDAKKTTKNQSENQSDVVVLRHTDCDELSQLMTSYMKKGYQLHGVVNYDTRVGKYVQWMYLCVPVVVL
jgi:hypothetical protein